MTRAFQGRGPDRRRRAGLHRSPGRAGCAASAKSFRRRWRSQSSPPSWSTPALRCRPRTCSRCSISSPARRSRPSRAPVTRRTISIGLSSSCRRKATTWSVQPSSCNRRSLACWRRCVKSPAAGWRACPARARPVLACSHRRARRRRRRDGSNRRIPAGGRSQASSGRMGPTGGLP